MRVFLSVAWVCKPTVAVVKLTLERLLTWKRTEITETWKLQNISHFREELHIFRCLLQNAPNSDKFTFAVRKLNSQQEQFNQMQCNTSIGLSKYYSTPTIQIQQYSLQAQFNTNNATECARSWTIDRLQCNASMPNVLFCTLWVISHILYYRAPFFDTWKWNEGLVPACSTSCICICVYLVIDMFPSCQLYSMNTIHQPTRIPYSCSSSSS